MLTGRQMHCLSQQGLGTRAVINLDAACPAQMKNRKLNYNKQRRSIYQYAGE